MTTHGRSAAVIFRLSCMSGRATAMIVMSSTIMSWVVTALVITARFRRWSR